jgi:hypothetical protein
VFRQEVEIASDASGFVVDPAAGQRRFSVAVDREHRTIAARPAARSRAEPAALNYRRGPRAPAFARAAS